MSLSVTVSTILFRWVCLMRLMSVLWLNQSASVKIQSTAVRSIAKYILWLWMWIWRPVSCVVFRVLCAWFLCCTKRIKQWPVFSNFFIRFRELRESLLLSLPRCSVSITNSSISQIMTYCLVIWLLFTLCCLLVPWEKPGLWLVNLWMVFFHRKALSPNQNN